MTKTQQKIDTNVQANGSRPRSEPTIRISAKDNLNTDAQQRAKGLETILAVDDRVRRASSVREMQHVVVNESRKITGARQIFLARLMSPSKFRVQAVSSLALVERDTPLIRWVENALATISKERGADKQIDFALPAFVDPDADETKTYPFRHLVWHPLKLTSGETFGGLLYARERAWQTPELRVIARQSNVYANAWQALAGKRKLQPTHKYRQYLKYVALVILALGSVVPVPLTALAPVEIIERNAEIIAAPIDGVVAKLLVNPNEKVTSGQTILRFEDTALRNRYQIKDREMLVAKTKYDRAQRAAFTDPKSRHELNITKTEYELKKSERDYAADLLARAEVKAPRAGILIYSDKNKLLGRPVKTGERLMKIGVPNDIQARIDLPVADAIILEQDAKVRIFLDASPFEPRHATIKSESYHAEPNASKQLVYTIKAELDDDQAYPRIGARGTAQVYGETVPLFFYLLRKPISAGRQYFGL